MPKRSSRLYWRGGRTERVGGRTVRRARRAYADFRDYADVGGSQEPLIPQGGRYATTDPDEAAQLIVARLDELKQLRTDKAA